MWKWLKLIIQFVLTLVLNSAQKKLVRRARAQGVLVYLRALRLVRLSLVGLIALIAFLQLMILSFFGLVALFIYQAPLESDVKIWLGFGLLGAGVFLPLLLIAFFLSEKLWFRASGAKGMVDALTAKPD